MGQHVRQGEVVAGAEGGDLATDDRHHEDHREDPGGVHARVAQELPVAEEQGAHVLVPGAGRRTAGESGHPWTRPRQPPPPPPGCADAGAHRAGDPQEVGARQRTEAEPDRADRDDRPRRREQPADSPRRRLHGGPERGRHLQRRRPGFGGLPRLIAREVVQPEGHEGEHLRNRRDRLQPTDGHEAHQPAEQAAAEQGHDQTDAERGQQVQDGVRKPGCPPRVGEEGADERRQNVHAADEEDDHLDQMAELGG